MISKRNFEIVISVLLMFIFFLLVSASVVHATIWNVQDDFNTTSNPNGSYSYGWESSLGSQFNLYDKSYSNGNGEGWVSSTISCSYGGPASWRNISESTIGGVRPNEVSLHPGCNGEFSIVRWTSPVAGTATIKGYFGAGDIGSMSYFIYKNDTKELFSIHNTGEDGSFSLIENVTIGTTIDFIVGDGYFYGNTPLQATIEIAHPFPMNVQNDFNITSNPNGLYSYGWESNLGAQFNLYDKSYSNGNGEGWISSTIGCSYGGPASWRNISGSTIVGIQPNEVSLHPGCNGEFSIIRWTSPMSGTVSIKGYFGAGDIGNMSYFIYKNGTKELFSIHNTGGEGPFNLLENVTIGTTIDFIVGEGYFYGNTPLHAVIDIAYPTKPPTISPMLLLLLE